MSDLSESSRKFDDAVWVIAFAVGLKAWVLSFQMPLRETPYAQHIAGDVRSWYGFWEACAGGAVPYVDIKKEYAVGVGLLYWAMTPIMCLADGDGDVILLLHGVLASLMDVVNAAILYRILREINARLAVPLTVLFVLLPTALVLSPMRFESFVTTTVLVGYSCHRSGRPGAAAFFWSIGCWLKWYPAFFIAAQEIRALVVEKRRWQWLRVSGVFLGVSLALNLPFIVANLMIHGNIDYWIYPYQFHSGRGISPDTILGVARMWLGEVPFSHYSSWWTLGLVGAALVVKPSLRIEYRCLLICLAMLVLNRIYSTQFNLWFYPFVILGAAQETPERRRWLLAMLVGLDLLNVLVFPMAYVGTLSEVGGFAPLSAADGAGIWTVTFSAAVILRGMVLVALAVFALRDQDSSTQSCQLCRTSNHSDPGRNREPESTAPRLRFGIPDASLTLRASSSMT
jgi:hypothetical protein